MKIETVRGRGYRLQANGREVSGTNTLRTAIATESPGDLAPPRTHFCTAHDGARLAYALLGEGAPLVKAANWLNHLELDWSSPIWRHWLRCLSRDHCLIRYDARGNGLSDWRPPSIRYADFVMDLGSVFDAALVRRAPLLGISQGASVAVASDSELPSGAGQSSGLPTRSACCERSEAGFVRESTSAPQRPNVLSDGWYVALNASLRA